MFEHNPGEARRLIRRKWSCRLSSDVIGPGEACRLSLDVIIFDALFNGLFIVSSVSPELNE